MKQFALLFMTLLTAYSSCYATEDAASKELCGSELHLEDLTVIPLTQLNNQELQEVMEGKHPNWAIAFPSGIEIPLFFYLKGVIFTLHEQETSWNTLKVKQTFYGRSNGQELLWSCDLIHWRPFMEFVTGVASLTLNVEEGSVSMTAGAEIHIR